MILVLMLALNNIDFKEVKVPCSEFRYSYTIEGTSNVYVRIKDEEYLTQYDSQDELVNEVDRQCKKK